DAFHLSLPTASTVRGGHNKFSIAILRAGAHLRAQIEAKPGLPLRSWRSLLWMMEAPMTNGAAAPRCAALIGPYLSGKTTLLEGLLHASGTTSRRGSVRDGNSVGDHSAEARARQMSTELNVANATFLGDPWTILDCPGSVELLYE